jgi:uncharacterized damage-inducible protein DinB
MDMNAVELLQRLHQHRTWVNSNLLTGAATLSDEQLRSAFQIGQGSVWKSLVHLYAAEYVWLEALLGNEAFLVPGDVPGKIPGNQQGEGGIAGLDDLRQKWSALEQRWSGYLATAAQGVNMLRQAGADKLPETMLISLARHEAT